MSSLYKDDKSKEEILKLYQEKLDSFKLKYERSTIFTSFGDTEVIIFGDKNKRPLVVVHGANGNSAVGVEPLLELLDDYCIYSIDVIGQPNFSSETRLSMKDNTYGLWLEEVINSLSLTNFKIYGMSFGGFLVLKYLQLPNNKADVAILHAPAGVVNGNPFIGIFKALLPMKKFMRTKKRKDLKKFLDIVFTEDDEFAIKSLEKVVLNMKMDFTPVPTLSKKDALKISTPVYTLTGELDPFFPGKKVIKRLKKIIPTFKDFVLLMNSKHVPTTKERETITNFIRMASK
jgi:pimeloyl-ACP methyl ester carboxylesterase